LDKYDKLKLLDGLETQTLPKGEIIIREGLEGESFYIIEEGSVECVKD
jgi:CRP-like cAMP-binding protein